MSKPFDWAEVVSDWVEGPCVGCSPSDGVEHVAMPVRRPYYVDDYIEQIAGPNEQHAADPNSHCDNPKCNFRLDPEAEAEVAQTGQFTCPQCGFLNQVQPEQQAFQGEGFVPGGRTRSGLTLSQMGQIGEQIVFRMGDLPGIGAVTPASDTYNFPIDAIVESQRGKFGCEVKTTHSQASEVFKIGGRDERNKKIAFCLQNGLKPALIGIRLNFYTDKAYVFFREGLSDTWIGNNKMLHVATVDFADLNPFKSPDVEAQALAVENAHLPDPANADDEFGWDDQSLTNGLTTKTADMDQPRDDQGKFTFKHDVHELKVVDKKGKHTHTARRCKHCGHANYIPAGHKGRVECSTCGEDADRELRVAKVVLAGPNTDQIANQLGFQFIGRTGEGHRKYGYTDDYGTDHSIVVGSGAHGKRAEDIDAQRARQRMTRCLNGQCMHQSPQSVVPVDEPGAPMARAGQTVMLNGKEQFVLEIDGGVALVYDTQTGVEDVVPASELRAVAAKEPDYLFVYYMSEIRVEKFEHNLRHEDMLERLCDEFGVDMGNTMMDIDPTQVAAGEIFVYPDGTNKIEHKQLSLPEVRRNAERKVEEWLDSAIGEKDEPNRDPDTGQWMPA